MADSATSNGVGGQASGQSAVDTLVEEQRREITSEKLGTTHDHVLKTFRLLVADLCQNFSGGHPGSAMGAAAIGLALWKYEMRYAPHSAGWFNRDRFVLSNGHACLLQYTYHHLVGYREMTLDMLKSYHSSRPDGLCPGHPEMEHEGIEVTTGPLGQGVGNAVGMAAAARHLGASFNRPGFDVVNCQVWCMVGDACLQEGVALEAISLAGHWQLGNLTMIYDNNQITCDGSVDMVNTEDVNAKMQACGWQVLEVADGCFDVAGLVAALDESKKDQSRPTFINVKTVIGIGSKVAGDAVAHGVALAVDDVVQMKHNYGFSSDEKFTVSAEAREFFANIVPRGEAHVEAWKELLAAYSAAHPELSRTFKSRMAGELPSDWKSLVPSADKLSTSPTATRASTGHALAPLATAIPTLMLGTADLTPSVNLSFTNGTSFNPPSLHPTSGPAGSYTGRYIHYGIREHSMCAIANGLAAFSPGTIIPVTSSFQMFYLYAAAAVRMGALMGLQVLHAATHDSIGMGEDGPTHQPLELAALLRAMPRLRLFRPGDAEETAGAWLAALRWRGGPTMVSTSRHKVRQQTGKTSRAGVAAGAYVLDEDDAAQVTLLGVGAELEIAVEAAEILKAQGWRVRLVSFPCTRLFDEQPRKYRRRVLRRVAVPGGGREGEVLRAIPAVVVEPYTGTTWAAYADAGVVMSTERFGQSLPGTKVYEYFGFTPSRVAERVNGYMKGLESGEYVKGEWTEL